VYIYSILIEMDKMHSKDWYVHMTVK